MPNREERHVRELRAKSIAGSALQPNTVQLSQVDSGVYRCLTLLYKALNNLAPPFHRLQTLSIEPVSTASGRDYSLCRELGKKKSAEASAALIRRGLNGIEQKPE